MSSCYLSYPSLVTLVYVRDHEKSFDCSKDFANRKILGNKKINIDYLFIFGKIAKKAPTVVLFNYGNSSNLIRID